MSEPAENTPGSVSDALGNAGGRITLVDEKNKKTIEFGLITQKIKAKFETWLFERSALKLNSLHGKVFQGVLGASLASLASNEDERKWGTGKEFLSVISTPHGVAKVLSLISIDKATQLPISHEAAEKYLLSEEHGDYVGHLYQEILRRSFPPAAKKN